MRAVEAPGQKVPAGHTLQLMLPACAWYVPASHGVQLWAPSFGLTVPGAQSVAFAEPTGQKVPAGHVMHCSALVITAMLVSCRVPPGHGSGAAEPCGQK